MDLEQPSEVSHPACNESINQMERNIALLVYGGSGIVSVVTSLVAVVLIVLMKLYMQFMYRLALYQEFSSIFISLTQCVGLLQLNFPGHERPTYDSFAACTASALLLQYALWVKLMFTVWLIFHLFVLAVFLKNFQRLELLYVFSSLLVPIIPTCIPLFTQAYGKDGARCWIKERNSTCSLFDEGLIERYVLWYGPAVIALVVVNLSTLVMLYVMRRRAYAEVDPELTPLVKKNKQALKQMLPLVFYPLLFLVLMMIPLITRIISDVIRTYDHFPLALMHGIAYPPGGFFSGLVVIIHLCVMHSQKKKKRSALRDIKPPPAPVNAPAPASKKPLSKFSFLV